MPNYLVRVAATGMRTSISARPPVAGPPILPGHRLPGLTVATGIEQGEGQVIQHGIEEELVVPALPAADVTLQKPVPPSAPESTHLEDQVPSTIDATPVIQAPRTLRLVAPNKPVSPGAPESTHLEDQVPPTINTTPVIRASRTLRPVYKAHPEPLHLHQEQAVHPGISTSPASPASAATSSSTTPQPITSSIKEPTGKGIAMAGTSLSAKPVQSSDMSPIAAVNEVKPVNQAIQSTALPVTDKVLPEREHDMPPAQAVLKPMNTPPMPPAHSSSRQVKLTIGRVDVQVKNLPPAPPAGRLPSMDSQIVTDTLEQHYLDRFRLKL